MKFKLAFAGVAMALVAFMACEKEDANLTPANGSSASTTTATTSSTSVINVNTGSFISLPTALGMINHFNNLGCDNYTKANAYGRNKIEDLLNQSGAVAIRAYHGTKDVLINGNMVKTRELILVAVDGNGNDLIKGTSPLILDASEPCPTECDQNSALLTEPVTATASTINANSGSFITLQQALVMRDDYKNNGCFNFTQGNAYGKNNITQLLAQNGAVGLRFYHGSKSEVIDGVGQVTRELIIAAIDNNGNDILVTPLILDMSDPCPIVCDTYGSPLL